MCKFLIGCHAAAVSHCLFAPFFCAGCHAAYCRSCARRRRSVWCILEGRYGIYCVGERSVLETMLSLKVTLVSEYKSPHVSHPQSAPPPSPSGCSGCARPSRPCHAVVCRYAEERLCDAGIRVRIRMSLCVPGSALSSDQLRAGFTEVDSFSIYQKHKDT